MTMLSDGNKIVVSVEEFEYLLERDRFLTCLEGCGVDSWAGYADAQEMNDVEQKADNTILAVCGGITSEAEIGKV